MSTISNVGSSQVQATQTQKLSPSEAKAAWEGVLNSAVSSEQKIKAKSSLAYLGDSRINRYKEKVSADMEKFVRENPNATAEEIQDAANKSVSKHRGYETTMKMANDYFMSKIMARGKELSQDMWG
ncbi:hypothetical protein [Vitiosangium sp. GDMCC 1.1324]|uniref:hypothetical protein n=1 Tax=Vitiosangium sp. (strain GDMCC 1.1324) TaxID=2138576 RepID=UPI000D36A97B|nr:hypothetical protein [Vitiosangium sp. GDMCC 1.1324]PTL80497.1 hypothetical protein DAT35_28085 [Vitiosangium sp. GDMCC 1.1324]